MIPQRRKVTFVAVAAAFVAFCVWATDSWKNTPYEKWTVKDVQKILNDSPWAKSITVPYAPFLNGNSREQDDQIKVGSATDPSGVADSRIYKPDGLFVLRWNSAITLRRALYRDAVLHGIPPDDAASRHLQNDPEYIELVLVPVGQTLLPPTEESNLMQETTLQFLPSGKTIRPANTQARAQVNSLGQEGYVFDFTRLQADGSSVIPKNTIQIEFFTQVGIRRFGAKFKTGDMAVKDGPDYF